MVITDGEGMDTTFPDRDFDTSVVGIVRTLLLIQGAIAVLSTIEVAIAGAAQGIGPGPIVLLTAGAAAVTLGLARQLGRRSRRGRKAAIWIELVVLLFATVDLLLAVALARRGLELVPVMTRIVLPTAVIRLLRRREVLAEFGLPPTRRQARKANIG